MAVIEVERVGQIEVRAGEGYVSLVIGGLTFELETEQATKLADLLSTAATFAVMSADAKARENDRG